jgi:glycosyltransferase involved in cell wall biosynthesis
MAKVTVIIPTYNRAPLLRRAIASVLDQTVDDFEIIVADDASTDGTGDMVQALRDRRIKYRRHRDNRGVAAARNTAIAHATGEYLAFLDDDDEWLPEKLRRQLDRMEAVGKSGGAVYCGHFEVETATNRILTEVKPSLRGRVSEQLLAQGSFNPTSTLLVRAECFQKVGVFDPALQYGEDFDMWVRLARQYDFDLVEEPLVRIHYQASGLTQNYRAIISGGEMYLSKYREFFERNPMAHSSHLHRLGTYYCFIGDLRKGREMFGRAVRLNPTFLKSYLGFVLSLAGGDAFRGSYAAKDRLEVLIADLKSSKQWRREL